MNSSPNRTSLNLLLFLVLSIAAPATAGFSIGPPTQIGTVASGTLGEISGLVESRTSAATFWVHNDSGDAARFYAMSHEGSLLGTYQLAGVTARDWEDMAIGPKSGGGNYLYLGDVGDNDAVRLNVAVHRLVEPLSTGGGSIAAGGFQTLLLKYPNGARDVESIFVDPIAEEMFFITKRRLVPEVYSFPLSAFDTATEAVTLTSWGTFSTLSVGATAADISPDGRFILVRTSASATGRLFERLPGQSVADALRQASTAFTLGPESQGEAIAWSADGTRFYSTSELDGSPTAPIHAYSFTVTQPLLSGDFNDDGRVDAADYSVWRDARGAEIALPNEDQTPGLVTDEDLETWRSHFGEGRVNGAGPIAAPEPAAWLLWAATLLSGLTRGSRFPAAACPGACT